MSYLDRLLGRSPRYISGNPNRVPDEALTAAGFRVQHTDTDQLRRLIQPWQARTFSYYDQLGEIKYAAQFYARMLAPLRLYAAKLDENGDYVEIDAKNPSGDDALAVEALDRIQDPGGGRESLLSSYGRLMFLTGECYLLCSKDPETGDEQWEMLSTDELRIQSGVYIRYRAPSLAAENLHEAPDDDFEPLDATQAVAYRLWQRHPRWSMLPDSTMMGVLDLCEELLLLTRAVRARARSRLAGSGLLAISEDFSHSPLEATGDEDADVDPFLADLRDAMLAPITNEGAASQVVPIVIRGPTAAIQNGIKHIQIVDPTQLYPETGLRTECIHRIALGLDMPPEILEGISDSNHWCADDNTEILTTDGWKLQGALEVGDTALTLNHRTGMSEWKPVDDIARFEVSDLPMISIESRYHSSLTTLNHRWPVLKLTGRARRWEREWTYSEELRTTHRLVTAAPSRDALLPQWVQHDDALVELVGWLWTEGQIRERPGRLIPQVAIHQSHTANPENVLRIRAALTSLYGAAVAVPMRGGRGSAVDQVERWREVTSGGMTRFLLNGAAAERLLLHVGPDRIVSTDFVRTLTAAQLALFIDISTRADGSTMRSGCQIVGQKDAARLAPLELAAILLGRSPSSYSQTHDGFTIHEQHYVSVSDRQTVPLKKAHIREVRYTGTIWCPVTENATWCARRNGRVFFTGNTAWQIDDQTWTAHGMPKANQLVSDLTQSFFRPELRAQGVADYVQYAIGYDAAAVVNQPDKLKDAIELFDRVIVGKTYVRDAAGISEDSAPTEEERAERIGIIVRDSSLAWFGTPAPRGGSVETAPGEITSPAGDSSPAGSPDSSGSSTEEGPPEEPDGPPSAPVVAAALNGKNGNGKTRTEEALALARIAGAADLALLRAREAAGNRIRSLVKNDEEASALIDGVPGRDVAATLGIERVRALGLNERELVAGAMRIFTETLRLWGLDDDERARLIAEQIEKHTAKTLYDERPAPLPPTFQRYVSGVFAQAV